ncbi:MAG: hypothetical protein ACLP1X_20450 [Polyangiaceae bacterium]
MPPRTPEALWLQLVDEAGEALVERAAAVSVAEAEKDLAAAGFDVAAERVRAVARIAALESPGRG